MILINGIIRLIIFQILILSFSLSCIGNKEINTSNHYKVFPAFEWENFMNYKFYWAIDKNDSSFLIVTKKDQILPQIRKYQEIVKGHSYKLTLIKIDSSFSINASVDEIVNDENGNILFKNNHFLIPVYSSLEIIDSYIEIEN